MLYHGVDLVEIARIEQATKRWGERFLQRVYTPAEIAAYRDKPSSLAARWAAKEAIAKLLGVGLRGLGAGPQAQDAVALTEIEVLSDEVGRPTVQLHGRAAARAAQLGISEIAISLTHTESQALASAIAH
jgi:holo-[acyl-carrier protein] synthase